MNTYNIGPILIAKKILCFPYVTNEQGKTIKRDDCSLWDIFRFDRDDMDFFLAIIRKTLADDFPLDDYYFFERPISEIAYFVHKADSDAVHLHNNEDLPIREIGFVLNKRDTLATPLKTIYNNDGSETAISVKTCQDAVVSH